MTFFRPADLPQLYEQLPYLRPLLNFKFRLIKRLFLHD